MKLTIPVSALLAAVVLLSAGWKNALAPQGKSVPLNLGEFTAIVTSPNPDAREKFAAEQLCSLLEKAAGHRLAILHGKAASGRSFRFAPDDPALGRDGYRIEWKDGNVILSGGTGRGVINAVIAFLEEDLGFRWYAPKEPPRSPDLTAGIRLVPRTWTPPLMMREPFYANAFDPEWEIFNRTNQTWLTAVPESLGGAWNFPKNGFCHTLNTLLPPGLFAEHPEYFALIDGKRRVQCDGQFAAHLCMTHPDVPDIVAKNAIALLRAQKTPCEIISISQNDGGNGFCQCEKCAEFTRREGSVAGPLLHFVNQVAERINREFPDMKIETLAYLESFLPPKTVRPGKNVMIRLCTDSHAWYYPMFFIEETPHFYNALKQWSKCGADFLIWDYVVDFHNYPMPNPNLRVMDHNFDVFLNHSAKGIMLQGSYQSPGGADAILKSWIFAKRLWNPQWKLEELLDDFIDGYYGKAAPPIRDSFAFQNQQWKVFHDTSLKQIKSGEKPRFEWDHKAIRTMKSFLERAYQLAGNDARLKARLQLQEFNYLYMRLSAGPENEHDIAAFRKDIATFSHYASLLKVTHCQENGSDQIAAKIKAFECGIVDVLYRPIPRGAFRFCPHNVTLWSAGKQTARSIKQGDSILLAQDGGAEAWSMQWRFDFGNYAPGLSSTKFPPGMKYKLQVKCRADVEPEAEHCFSVAVYDQKKKACFGEIRAMGSDFKTGKWVTLESSVPFMPDESAILYVSPSRDKRLKTLYIDHILLVPVSN